MVGVVRRQAMRETLATWLGETGAIIAQYVITLAFILAVIAVVVFAIRRFRLGGSGATARARLPRLAVVDALVIDGKRRLVLVRRDNVEHLVLIGGPTDIVVEPSILRQRVAQRPGQPAGRPVAPVAVAPPPPPPPPVPEASPEPPLAARAAPLRASIAAAGPAPNPIPFPPRRSPIRASDRPSGWRRDTARSTPPASPAYQEAGAAAAMEDEAPATGERAAMVERARQTPPRFNPPVRPMAEEASGPAPAYAPPEPERVEAADDAPQSAAPAPVEAEDGPPGASVFAPPASDRQAASPAAGESADLGETVEVPGAPPTAAAEPSAQGERPAGVSDLEKEMARLLDEISTNRQG
jgi:flagellar protein FliO/FliZ